MSDQRYYSNIYWHFTGSPPGLDWSTILKPADLQPHQVKSPREAFDIARKILGERPNKLLATAKSDILRRLPVDDHDTRQKIWESYKFCCVTDIPLKDLPSHKKYYGDVAIGFSAEPIHKGDWEPIRYISQKTFDYLVNALNARWFFMDALDYVLTRAADVGIRISFGIEGDDNWTKEMPLWMLPQTIEAFSLDKEWFNFIKVTAFAEDSEKTFYREREWRHEGDFLFAAKDVVALVVPKSFVGEASRLVKQARMGDVSILSWDVIEKG